MENPQTNLDDLSKLNKFIPPVLLSNPDFRFVRIVRGSKSPISEERNWATTGNMGANDQRLIEHLAKGGNYGILGGFGGLIIIDCDSIDLYRDVYDNLPKTFTIKTGRDGRHFFYYCPEIDKSYNIDGDGSLGTIVSFGKYVVGAGSLHPNGNRYSVIEDAPIATITKEQIHFALKEWFNREIEKTIQKNTSERNSEFGVIQIPILDVIDVKDATRSSGNHYYMSHPIHGSTNGMNLHINGDRNVWYCHRCQSGGDALAWIAVQEKIIGCHEAKNGLRGETFKRVVGAANFKYKQQITLAKPQRSLEAGELTPEQILAQKYIDEDQPMYLDEQEVLWAWDNENKYYKMIDDVDLANIATYRLKISGMNKGGKRHDILRAFKDYARRQKPEDLNPKWIQFKNIIVDITGYKDNDLKIIEPSPKYFLSNPLPCNFINDPNIQTPKFDKLFKDWVGEKYVPTLYEIIAYGMIPEYKINTMFFLLGSGRNGKTTFQKIIKRILGHHNITSSSIERLDVKVSRFETASLYKKLLCFIDEADKKTLDSSSTIKALTGEGDIKAEIKGKGTFTFNNYAKILIATNHMPRNTDKSDGWFRRSFIIDFPNKFEENADVFSDITEEDYDMLASKCIYILMDLLRRMKFTNHGTVEERAQRYEERSDPFGTFMKKYWVEGDPETDWVWQFELRDFYQKWSLENGYGRVTDHEFNTLIKEKRLETGTKLNPAGKTKWVTIHGFRRKEETQNSISEHVNNDKNNESTEKSQSGQSGQYISSLSRSREVSKNTTDMTDPTDFSKDRIIINKSPSEMLNFYPEDEAESFHLIFEKIEKAGFTKEEIEIIHRELEKTGRIFSPRSGFWRRM